MLALKRVTKKKIKQSINNFLNNIFSIEILQNSNYIILTNSLQLKYNLKYIYTKMSIKIGFKKTNSAKITSNLVLFVDEKFNMKHIKKYISSSEFSYISDLLKISDLKKKLLVFNLNSKKKNCSSLN